MTNKKVLTDVTNQIIIFFVFNISLLSGTRN